MDFLFFQPCKVELKLRRFLKFCLGPPFATSQKLAILGTFRITPNFSRCLKSGYLPYRLLSVERPGNQVALDDDLSGTFKFNTKLKWAIFGPFAFHALSEMAKKGHSTTFLNLISRTYVLFKPIFTQRKSKMILECLGPPFTKSINSAIFANFFSKPKYFSANTRIFIRRFQHGYQQG